LHAKCCCVALKFCYVTFNFCRRTKSEGKRETENWVQSEEREREREIETESERDNSITLIEMREGER
jgi:hypothetical protein